MTDDDDFNKFNSLDLAIKARCGDEYNDYGMVTVNPDKIVEAAKKFEAYLKGNTKND